MLRTYYYFIATYFYLDLVGGIVFSTSFDQFFDWFLTGDLLLLLLLLVLLVLLVLLLLLLLVLLLLLLLNYY